MARMTIPVEEFKERVAKASKETGDAGVAMILDHFRRVLK